jgi:putative membrane protein|tara:strand:- start:5501 stop:6337 length:837 start_codon:yes stop_codon:yes gene_type:complete
LNNDIRFLDFIKSWEYGSAFFYILIFAILIYLIGSIKLFLVSNNKQIFKFFRGLIGYIFLFSALVGPISSYEDTFWVHMIQHMLLIMIVPPLILSGLFFSANLWFFPRIIRIGLADYLRPTSYFRKIINKITSPKFSLIFYVISLWTWHLPIFFNYALDFNAIHNFEHFIFFISGILFWWPVLGMSIGAKKITIPIRIVYLLLAVTPTAVVAAFITLADSVLYGENIPRLFNIEAIEDQKIGGLIMWIPGNIIFIATLTTLFFKWSYVQNQNERKFKN